MPETAAILLKSITPPNNSLIKCLQELQREHGDLPVKVEAKATGLDWQDETGNRIEDHTINAAVVATTSEDDEDGNPLIWILARAKA
jgi:hypothetical protein